MLGNLSVLGTVTVIVKIESHDLDGRPADTAVRCPKGRGVSAHDDPLARRRATHPVNHHNANEAEVRKKQSASPASPAKEDCVPSVGDGSIVRRGVPGWRKITHYARFSPAKSLVH